MTVKEIFDDAMEIGESIGEEIKGAFDQQVNKQKLKNDVNKLKQEVGEIVQDVKQKVTNKLDKQ
ncbi:MAG: hypothetical protein BEN19_06490 [Epulopiscium sp. Nuni2H_MBin003]|nr:MAG: hypothetical protein BEN19_06490 [Epulopiscium sp. Nuni2H_MBin003]